jgi:spoIIIJ-associated protein
MTAEQTSAMGAEPPQEKLRRLLQLMGFETTVECFEEKDGEILLHVSTPDAALLIGRNGQVLAALQTVINRMIRSAPERRVHYVVDIERYRERRKDKLLKMAYDAAEQVERTGRSVKLPPMTAHDRRIVHQALKDRPGLKTASEPAEEEGEKRVVVSRA